MSTVTIAPHLWKALEVMGRDMAVEPGALVNQALFAWLRINGYVVPGTIGAVAAAPVEVSPAPAATAPSPPELETVSPPEPAPSQQALELVLRRIEEIEGDLAVLVKPRPAWARAEEPDADEQQQDEREDTPDEEGVSEPNEVNEPPESNTGESTIPADSLRAPFDDAPAEGTFVLRSAPVVLVIERDGQTIRVEKDPFIIGRGPQCDLVIESPRVSREHVSLRRQGVTFVLEDLGSSNGTWLGEERLTTRELEDGDTILLGNEAVKFSLEPGG